MGKKKCQSSSFGGTAVSTGYVKRWWFIVTCIANIFSSMLFFFLIITTSSLYGIATAHSSAILPSFVDTAFVCTVALTNLISKYNPECTFCKVMPFNSKLDILSPLMAVKKIKQSRTKLVNSVKLATRSRRKEHFRGTIVAFTFSYHWILICYVFFRSLKSKFLVD